MQIIVLGMHRSGTSLVTRLLHAMGGYVGAKEDLLPAMECNAEGFWERRDVQDINEDLLESLNASWDNPVKVDVRRLSVKALRDFNNATVPVVDELNQHQPWVVKDPRLSLFMSLWQPMLKSPFAVICWRNPLEVANSLKQRDGLPLAYGLALWEWYTISALKYVADIPSCLVSYNDLLQDPIASTAKLYKDSDNALNGKLKPLTSDEVGSIINPTLHHERDTEATEDEHLSLAQYKLWSWLKNPEGDYTNGVSLGARSVLKEIGQLRTDLRASNQRITAANEAHERSEKRTLRVMNYADGLSDAAEMIFNSLSGKISLGIGNVARFFQSGTTVGPELFMKKVGSDYQQWKKDRDFSVIAILNTYNEEKLIRVCLEHLRKQGLDFIIIDNESTDRTIEIAKEFEGKGLIAVETIHRDNNFSLIPLLIRKEELASELCADWFMHVDCDEFRFPPAPYKTLKEAFVAVDFQGFNAVEFMEYTFVATKEHPEHDPETFLNSMQWYYSFQPFRPHRINAWKRCKEPVELKSFGGHQVNFPGRKVCPEYFILKHYTYLNRKSAIEKFVNTVFDPSEDDMHGFRHGLCENDIILPSENQLRKFISNDKLDASNPRTERYIAEAWHRRQEAK